MEFAPSPDRQPESKQSLILESLPSLPHSGDVVISCTIAESSSPSSRSSSTNIYLTIGLDSIEPEIAQQLRSMPLPLNCHCQDPSILHLVQLLQIEIQAPQAMSQMFVSSIATVLTTHLFRHGQAARCDR
jgi:hypothetical protein